MIGINKIIISCLLLIALIAVPITGCVGRGNLPPIADFTYSPHAPPTADNVIFTDKSGDGDGNIVSWAWEFGDGNTSANQNPSHSFQDPGTYTVTLTVTADDVAWCRRCALRGEGRAYPYRCLPDLSIFVLQHKYGCGPD